jgi:hypothetical protein
MMLTQPGHEACTNHDLCALDLPALRARTKEVLALRIASQQNIDAILKQSLDPFIHNDRRLELLGQARLQQRELCRLEAEQRLLYATRAHHRGKVAEIAAERYQKHSLGRSIPGYPGTQTPAQEARDPLAKQRGHECYTDFVKRMLPLQAEEVAKTWQRFATRKPRAVAG